MDSEFFTSFDNWTQHKKNAHQLILQVEETMAVQLKEEMKALELYEDEVLVHLDGNAAEQYEVLEETEPTIRTCDH